MPAAFGDGASELVALAQQHACATLVVGLPVARSGELRVVDSDSRVGRLCRNFAHTLAMVAEPRGLEVYLVDETLSTREAQELVSARHRSSRVRNCPRVRFFANAQLELHAHSCASVARCLPTLLLRAGPS